MNLGSIPNYLPSVDAPPVVVASQYEQPANHEQWIGHVTNFEDYVTDQDFVQPREVWEMLGHQKGQQENFVFNVACNLYGALKVVRFTSYG